jgi:hypothetical protein
MPNVAASSLVSRSRGHVGLRGYGSTLSGWGAPPTRLVAWQQSLIGMISASLPRPYRISSVEEWGTPLPSCGHVP